MLYPIELRVQPRRAILSHKTVPVQVDLLSSVEPQHFQQNYDFVSRSNSDKGTSPVSRKVFPLEVQVAVATVLKGATTRSCTAATLSSITNMYKVVFNLSKHTMDTG